MVRKYSRPGLLVLYRYPITGSHGLHVLFVAGDGLRTSSKYPSNSLFTDHVARQHGPSGVNLLNELADDVLDAEKKSPTVLDASKHIKDNVAHWRKKGSCRDSNAGPLANCLVP